VVHSCFQLTRTREFTCSDNTETKSHAGYLTARTRARAQAGHDSNYPSLSRPRTQLVQRAQWAQYPVEEIAMRHDCRTFRGCAHLFQTNREMMASFAIRTGKVSSLSLSLSLSPVSFYFDFDFDKMIHRSISD